LSQIRRKKAVQPANSERRVNLIPVMARAKEIAHFMANFQGCAVPVLQIRVVNHCTEEFGILLFQIGPAPGPAFHVIFDAIMDFDGFHGKLAFFFKQEVHMNLFSDLASQEYILFRGKVVCLERALKGFSHGFFLCAA